MPEYPRSPGFEVVQADAQSYPLDGFDRRFDKRPTIQRGPSIGSGDSVGKVTRSRLIFANACASSNTPYLIENVIGAPLLDLAHSALQGAMFGRLPAGDRTTSTAGSSRFSRSPATGATSKRKGNLVTGEYEGHGRRKRRRPGVDSCRTCKLSRLRDCRTLSSMARCPLLDGDEAHGHRLVLSGRRLGHTGNMLNSLDEQTLKRKKDGSNASPPPAKPPKSPRATSAARSRSPSIVKASSVCS